jgi:hypothetical protein
LALGLICLGLVGAESGFLPSVGKGCLLALKVRVLFLVSGELSLDLIWSDLVGAVAIKLLSRWCFWGFVSLDLLRREARIDWVVCAMRNWNHD